MGTDLVLPPDVAALAELLLERIDASTGEWRVELWAIDGKVRRYARQETGGRDAMARFDRTTATPPPPPEGRNGDDKRGG